MSKGLLLLVALIVLSACATSGKSSKPDTRLLCIKTTMGGEEVADCLNPLSADPTEVRRRIVMYNSNQKKEKHIDCVHKKSLGSNFTRWGCYLVNSPNVSPDFDANFINLINKGDSR